MGQRKRRRPRCLVPKASGVQSRREGACSSVVSHMSFTSSPVGSLCGLWRPSGTVTRAVTCDPLVPGAADSPAGAMGGVLHEREGASRNPRDSIDGLLTKPRLDCDVAVIGNTHL